MPRSSTRRRAASRTPARSGPRLPARMAMFAGVGSPITQTFGLGIHQPPGDRDLDAIERFFTSRGSAVFHEVSPLAGVDVLATLVRRGYKPIEVSNVHVSGDRRVHAGAAGAIRVLAVRALSCTKPIGTAASPRAAGARCPKCCRIITGFARSSVECATCFVAELDGQAIATAALFMHGGVALLAGASTVPEGRRQRRATRAARHPSPYCGITGMQSGDDGRRAGQRLATQCRAEWFPRRLYTHQMATLKTLFRIRRPAVGRECAGRGAVHARRGDRRRAGRESQDARRRRPGQGRTGHPTRPALAAAERRRRRLSVVRQRVQRHRHGASASAT